MSYRSEVEMDGRIWDLRVVVETDNKGGFPEAVEEQLDRISRGKKTAGRANRVDGGWSLDPGVFWMVQADITRTPKTYASLYAKPRVTGKRKRRAIIVDAPVNGKNVTEYDRMIRMLAY